MELPILEDIWKSQSSKMQHQFWLTKQALSRKFGRKEDECIVASDAELDAKLELFRNIQSSCALLQRIIDRYQEAICCKLSTLYIARANDIDKKIITNNNNNKYSTDLSQETSAMGRFLKENSADDKSRAGEVMLAVAKALIYCAQQQLTLHEPLVRFHQELETFRQRAIGDTHQNVLAMEKARTEYRASLSWMKAVSQQLDPASSKQLDKFKRVQDQVRRGKLNFDKLGLDCLQKVDLLAAARCNMLNHTLTFYQNRYIAYGSKSAKAYSTTLKNIENIRSRQADSEWRRIEKLVTDRTRGAAKSNGDKSKEKAKAKTPTTSEDQPQSENGSSSLIGDLTSAPENTIQTDRLIAVEESVPSTSDDATAGASSSIGDLQGLNVNATATAANPVYYDELQQALMSECKSILQDMQQQQQQQQSNTASDDGSKFDWLTDDKDSFMPMELLKQSLKSATTSSSSPDAAKSQGKDLLGDSKGDVAAAKAKKGTSAKSWMNLFEDLDPLSNNAAEKASKNESFLA
ncbi:islet cell autoantigen 1 isoform X1 [Trichogramma pretiosum]|uniref:islet cell autoantigen 1 isoform X1 n=1 Tax=Trichogramma pretiosum TaxID=7493 RepID=UPI000C719773|nr:islet cell autoantigen 1 isoform X1 [Trichogramma pretiosum]